MIPNVFHFILYTRPVEGREVRPFSILHYASIRSCIETQNPDRVILWTNGGEPDGEWWPKIRDQVEVRELELVYEWRGLDFRRFGNLGHFCDVPRIQVVHEHGGVYADIDTLFVRDLAPLREVTTLFVQSEPSLSPEHDGPTRPMSSLIMAHAGDPTLRAVLELDPSDVRMPGVAREPRIIYCSYVFKHAHEVLGQPLRTEDVEALEVPVWASRDVLVRFFVEDVYRELEKGYVINVCESDSRAQFVRDLTLRHVWEHNTSFHRQLRQWLPHPDLPVTAIVPVMIDSQDRLENALTMIHHIHERLGVRQVVVAEGGRPMLFEHIRELPWVRYVLAYAPGLEFNKSKLVNMGLHLVDTPAVCVWDCDAVISALQVEAATDAILSGKYQVVAPLNRYLHVGRHVLQQVKAGRVDFGVVDRPEEILYTIDRVLSHGVCFFNTAALRHCRGYNELTWGWGCEDDEIIFRLTKLGLSYAKLTAPGLHIAHERTLSSTPSESYASNKAERDRVMNEPDESSLAAYFGVTKEIGDYSRQWRAKPAADSRSDPTSTG